MWWRQIRCEREKQIFILAAERQQLFSPIQPNIFLAETNISQKKQNLAILSSRSDKETGFQI